MDSKINWYKEVLALEPGSKLFFPLAKLQADNGDYLDALHTLQQGLEKHPEFLEAQLFLVEVLSNLGRSDEAQETSATLIDKVSRYAAFWEEWAKLAAYKEQDRDTALALNFLAASFTGNPISWSEIIEKGLLALLAEDDSGSSRSMRAHMNETMQRMAAKVSNNQLLESREPAGEDAAQSVEAAAGQQEENEETYSLRTRSMAELLAQQGDFAGAVDIYQELLGAAPKGTGRDELAARLQELQAQAQEREHKDAGEAPVKPKPEDESAAQAGQAALNVDQKMDEEAAETGEQQPKQGKKRLIHTLEALAQRLEARAAG